MKKKLRRSNHSESSMKARIILFFTSADKLLHLGINLLIVTFGTAAFGLLPAAILAVAISFAKEGVDEVIYDRFDIGDLLADAIGIFLGAATVVILHLCPTPLFAL